MATILQENNLVDDPLFAQAKPRGIKALAGHARKRRDLTNDVNGGPSGVGIAQAAGKAAFWDIAGTPDTPKIIALEGEFCHDRGPCAGELKTQALSLGVGKRLRIILSDNNAGIDDVLLGGVIPKRNTGYDLVEQWTSYGWNVLTLENGGDYGQVISAFEKMENWDASDRRPMILIGKTTKGYWPAASNGNLTTTVKQIVSYQSHPYGYKMNSDYFVALASTFEERYGVSFAGIRDGAVTNERDRLIQFKTNIDVAGCRCWTRTGWATGWLTAWSPSAIWSRTTVPPILPASPIRSWMIGSKSPIFRSSRRS